MQNEPETEQALNERVAEALDESVESLSPEIRRKLNHIRLSAVEKKSNQFFGWKQVTVMGVLVMAVISTQFLPEQGEPLNNTIANLSDDDLFNQELLMEDPEMLADLEFAYWIAEESELASL